MRNRICYVENLILFTKNRIFSIENNIDNIVKFVTLLDILQCKCFIANEFNYCKPKIKKYTDASSLFFFEFILLF